MLDLAAKSSVPQNRRDTLMIDKCPESMFQPVEHRAFLLQCFVIRIRVVIKILITNVQADGLLFMVDPHVQII